jgi:hypothetical protein
MEAGWVTLCAAIRMVRCSWPQLQHRPRLSWSSSVAARWQRYALRGRSLRPPVGATPHGNESCQAYAYFLYETNHYFIERLLSCDSIDLFPAFRTSDCNLSCSSQFPGTTSGRLSLSADSPRATSGHYPLSAQPSCQTSDDSSLSARSPFAASGKPSGSA